MPKLGLELIQNQVSPEVASIQQGMEKYGGEDAIFEKLGLGLEELSQVVEFGGHKGTLWEAVELSLVPKEERPPGAACPLGDRLQDAKQEGGQSSVVQVFEGFKMADPNFDVKFSERTIARGAAQGAKVKKKTLSQV